MTEPRTEPRSEAGAKDLVARMTSDILAEWHPAHYASPALDKRVSELAPMKGLWLDIATGTGRRVFQLLETAKFTGTVYAVEFQQDNAEELIKRFQEQKDLNQRINLIVLVTDAARLLEDDTVTAIVSNNITSQYENPFYKAKTKVDIVSTTEFWHEAWSCPALREESAQEGDKAYNASMKAVASVLNMGGYIFFQDLHGADKQILVDFSYEVGGNWKFGRHAVKWITQLDHYIDSSVLNPELMDNDDHYWTQGRKKLLRNTIAGCIFPDAALRLPLNVFIEASYRVVDSNGSTYVDRDHEMHCAKTGDALIADMIKTSDGNLKELWRHEIIGDIARKFFEHAGINIEAASIPSIYTSAVLQKQ